MVSRTFFTAAVAAALVVGTTDAPHAQDATASSTPYVYRVAVNGLSAPPPACVESVIQQTQTASCPAGQTVGGAADGSTAFTQSYEVTTTCPSGKYGAPVATSGDASPTAAATCSKPDPWSAFFSNLGVAAPNPWSTGFQLSGRGISALPATPYPATTVSKLVINNNQLTNVDGLSSLVKVDGELDLSNNQLTNVDGLSSLQSGRLVLNLSQNPNLSNVDGLSSLQYVDGALNLSQNANLTNLRGLSGMYYTGSLLLNNDPKLTDLSGLAAMANTPSVFFDPGIHLRPGFVPIPGGALCAVAGATKFQAGSATQAEVCASVH